MGKAGFSLARRVASRQAEVQHRNCAEFFDLLHSHVKASVAAIRMDVGSGTPGALAGIDELGATISDYRVQLLLAQDRVAVATLISESVRIVSGPLEVRATPRGNATSVGACGLPGAGGAPGAAVVRRSQPARPAQSPPRPAGVAWSDGRAPVLPENVDIVGRRLMMQAREWGPPWMVAATAWLRPA